MPWVWRLGEGEGGDKRPGSMRVDAIELFAMGLVVFSARDVGGASLGIFVATAEERVGPAMPPPMMMDEIVSSGKIWGARETDTSSNPRCGAVEQAKYGDLRHDNLP